MVIVQIIDRRKLGDFNNFLCILLYPVPWLVFFFETFIFSRVLCKLQSRFSF